MFFWIVFQDTILPGIAKTCRSGPFPVLDMTPRKEIEYPDESTKHEDCVFLIFDTFTDSPDTR